MKGIRLYLLYLFILLLGLHKLSPAETVDLLVQLPAWQSELTSVPDSATGSGLDENAREKISKSRMQVNQALKNKNISAKELADTYARLGAYYLHYSIYTLAELSYANAVKLSPQDFRWIYYLAFVAHQTGRTDLALQRYAKAKQLDNNYPPLDIRVGDLYLDRNQLNAAKENYQRAAAHKEFAAPAAYGLGQVALLRRDYPAAIKHYKTVLQYDPKATQTHYPLAQAYRALKQTDKARQHLALYAKGKPEIDDPLINSIKHLEQVAALHFNLGMTAIEQGKFDAARKEFQQGLELDPDNADAHVSYARVLFLSDHENLSPVYRELQQALKLDKNNTLASFLLGILAEAEGNRLEAISYYQKVLKIDPEHAGAHFYLSQLLLKSADDAAACPHVSRTIELEPMNLTAQLNYLYCLEQQNEPDTKLVKQLETLQYRFPDILLFPFYQIHILSLSQDANVRAPEKALKIAQGLTNKQPVPPHFGAMALASAARGDFNTAVHIQKDLIKSIEKQSRTELRPDEMQQPKEAKKWLALYQSGQLPELEKWFGKEELVLHVPVNPSDPFRYYPAPRPY